MHSLREMYLSEKRFHYKRLLEFVVSAFIHAIVNQLARVCMCFDKNMTLLPNL